jgi:DNA polymerase-1
MPDELEHQWIRAPALYEAFGWTVLNSDDLEADDLMGSLAAAEEEAGGTALILTADRDMFQCVTDRVHLLLQQARREGPEEFGPDEVRGRYGIEPAQVPDFIALRGDPSDGIPGAKGIGEKTAADLLRRHGGLEEAIAAAVRERPAVRSALIGQADELRTFKDLATLRRIDLGRPDDAPTDREGGAVAAEGLGMKRLAERLRS